MKKSVFVIGLGRFGKNLALNLIKSDVSVFIGDVDKKVVQEFADSQGINNSLIIDATNIESLNSMNIQRFDLVVVAMADIENSLLTCANLKDLGVKNIIAKAQNTIHSRLLKAIGVQNVIFPEKDSAIITAQQIIYDDITIVKQWNEISIVSVVIKADKFDGVKCKFIEKGIFKIFAVKPNKVNASLIYDIDQNYEIKKLDRLYIMCENNKLNLLKKVFKYNKTTIAATSRRF